MHVNAEVDYNLLISEQVAVLNTSFTGVGYDQLPAALCLAFWMAAL